MADIAKSREKTIQAIADLVADYRVGELDKPTPEHVERWLDQFQETEYDKTAFLAELHHVLSQTYLTKKDTKSFLSEIAVHEKFTGGDPASFWNRSNILDIQRGGNSQSEIRALFAPILQRKCGVSLDCCTCATGPSIYLDDAIFSGVRVTSDIRAWLPSAPKKSSLHVVVLALHSGGAYYVQKQVAAEAAKAGKTLGLTLWRALPLENLSNSGASCDVLRLKTFPTDTESSEYLASFGDDKPPKLLRPSNQPSTSRFYTDEQSRALLERVFWKAGMQIREMCPNLKVTHRPLGYTSTNSENRLGFGSLFVSYRNCPNNAPLALWVGDPWYPLFARKTN